MVYIFNRQIMMCMICSQHSSGPGSARQGRCIPDLYDPARAAGWEPCTTARYNQAQVSCLGSVLYADPARHLLTAGEDLDGLDRAKIVIFPFISWLRTISKQFRPLEGGFALSSFDVNISQVF